METVTRIEIITGAVEFPRVVHALEAHGVRGYVVFDVEGVGNRRVESADALTGNIENRLIKTTCPPEQAEALIHAIEGLLKVYGGTCVTYAARLIVH